MINKDVSAEGEIDVEWTPVNASGNVGNKVSLAVYEVLHTKIAADSEVRHGVGGA